MPALTDSHGRAHTYLRLSVTSGCNLSCVYCRPPGIPLRRTGEPLTLDQTLRLARLFVSLGVTKIRLTGGEPLLRDDLEDLIAVLSAMPGIEEVCLTTNGVLLAGRADSLRRSGLGRINISLDTLRPDRYLAITGSDRLGDTLAGIDAAFAAGFDPVKINVVVLGGINEDEIGDFLDLARERPLEVRFIEYMPVTPGCRPAASFVSGADVRAELERRADLTPIAATTGPQPVARTFAVAGAPGRVGLITAVSNHFCAHCGRLRLLADGSLQNCLFAAPAADLGGMIRDGASDVELAAAIGSALQRKSDRRAGPPTAAGEDGPGMCAIGG